MYPPKLFRFDDRYSIEPVGKHFRIYQYGKFDRMLRSTECLTKAAILKALEGAYHRKGLKWVNGECVPMTPEEFTEYLNSQEGVPT